MLTQYRLLDPWSKLTYEPLFDPGALRRSRPQHDAALRKVLNGGKRWHDMEEATSL